MSNSHENGSWPSKNVSVDSCFDIVDADSNSDATQLLLSQQHLSSTWDASTLNNSASTASNDSKWESAFSAHRVPTYEHDETKNTTIAEASIHFLSVASSFLQGASNPRSL
jgi:hypothetical protein